MIANNVFNPMGPLGTVPQTNFQANTIHLTNWSSPSTAAVASTMLPSLRGNVVTDYSGASATK